MLNIIGMTFPDPLQFGFVPEHGSSAEVLSKVVSSARRIAGIFRSLMLIPLFTAFSSDIKSFMQREKNQAEITLQNIPE
jgi:hypothetical protein